MSGAAVEQQSLIPSGLQPGGAPAQAGAGQRGPVDAA